MTPRIWLTINVSLGIIAVLLLLTLLGVTFPTFGKAQYLLDREQPLCVVNWKDNFNAWNDVDSCCLEARKQLECIPEQKQLESGRVDWNCRTGPGAVGYWLNNKAYWYCQQQKFW